MEGEGSFPGQFFTTFRYHCIPRHRICNGPIQFTGTEKGHRPSLCRSAIQPTGGDSHGHISERNLKESHRKITKNKSRTFTRLPLLRTGTIWKDHRLPGYDSRIPERIRFYFTSGNIKAKNTWDETYRSYLVPQYIARSLNLTNNGSDTLSPMFLTYEDIRFDVGTRKIFTLLRAIQLFGPLFDGIDSYDIRAIDTEDPDYTFTFQTRRSAYPERTRISCKGTLIIDRENYYVKNMTFDYIDYQLLRQTLLTNRRKTSSPFSNPMPNSPSFMIVADKTISLPAINKPPGNTTWEKILSWSNNLPGTNPVSIAWSKRKLSTCSARIR